VGQPDIGIKYTGRREGSILSLSLSRCLMYVYPLPDSLKGKEESAGWTLEGCKMNDIHRREQKHHGRKRN